jgi:hypothetical protein
MELKRVQRRKPFHMTSPYLAASRIKKWKQLKKLACDLKTEQNG